jgi:hypothetical protein
VYLWRFKDAPPDLACRASNAVPLLVNVKETTTILEQCTTLKLEWLIAMGPDSGIVLLNVESKHCLRKL